MFCVSAIKHLSKLVILVIICFMLKLLVLLLHMEMLVPVLQLVLVLGLWYFVPVNVAVRLSHLLPSAECCQFQHRHCMLHCPDPLQCADWVLLRYTAGKFRRIEKLWQANIRFVISDRPSVRMAYTEGIFMKYCKSVFSKFIRENTSFMII